MTKKILLNKDTAKLLNELMSMNGDEIYNKYGYKRDETFTYTVPFENGIEVDIKLVICEEDTPYIEGVMFKNGSEVIHTEPDFDSILGEYQFEYNNNNYVVVVEEEK